MEHIFKALKTSWGIWILIDAEEILLDNNTMNISEVSENIRIETSFRRKFFMRNSENQEEVDLILNGLKWVSPLFAVKKNHTIFIHKISFANVITDYQKEGLFYAIAEWAAKYYKFELPKYSYYYDRKTNKYYFNH